MSGYNSGRSGSGGAEQSYNVGHYGKSTSFQGKESASHDPYGHSRELQQDSYTGTGDRPAKEKGTKAATARDRPTGSLSGNGLTTAAYSQFDPRQQNRNDAGREGNNTQRTEGVAASQARKHNPPVLNKNERPVWTGAWSPPGGHPGGDGMTHKERHEGHLRSKRP